MSEEHTSGGPNRVKSASTPRILVVEDQDDFRRLLVMALELEGHEVDEAVNALQGLARMEQSHYDLILTDYAMPGGTGTWMLREAARRRLIANSVAMVITAHPDVRAVSNVAVVPKPLDLDKFLDHVRRLLATTAAGAAPARAASRPHERSQGNRVELVLYVSAASPASLQAGENLERLLSQFNVTGVTLTIRDVTAEPLAAEEDGIAFTPTLVKRHPEPRMWILGNFRDPEILADLLRVCGVEPRPKN